MVCSSRPSTSAAGTEAATSPAGRPRRATASATATSGTPTSASRCQRSGTPVVKACRHSSRTRSGPSTILVITTAGSSIPTSMLAQTKDCATHGWANKVNPAADPTTGAKANICRR